MTKYLCKCGDEIKRLVICGEDSASGPSISSDLCCNSDANSIIETVKISGEYIIDDIPIFIDAPTKKAALNQVVHQYIKNRKTNYWLPRSQVKYMLSEITKV